MFGREENGFSGSQFGMNKSNYQHSSGSHQQQSSSGSHDLGSSGGHVSFSTSSSSTSHHFSSFSSSHFGYESSSMSAMSEGGARRGLGYDSSRRHLEDHTPRHSAAPHQYGGHGGGNSFMGNTMTRVPQQHHSQASGSSFMGNLLTSSGLSDSDRSSVREALSMAGISVEAGTGPGRDNFKNEFLYASSSLSGGGGGQHQRSPAPYESGLGLRNSPPGHGLSRPCDVVKSEVWPLQPIRKHRLYKPVTVRKLRT